MGERDNEGYYAVAAFLSIVITLIIHYFFISQFFLHPTIHAGIGILIFILLTAFFSLIFSKLW